MFYWEIGARLELELCSPTRKLFILVLLVVLSPYFIFVFGAEILLLACSGTFLRKPELMQKLYLTDICTHHLIGRFSTHSLVAQSSISYVEHLRQKLMFHRYVIYE